MFEIFFKILPMFVSFIWLILFVAHIKKSNRSQKFMIYFVAVIFMLYTCHALFFSRLNTPFVDVVYAFANLAVFPMFYIYMKYVTSFSKVKLKWFYTLIPAVVLSGCCALGYIFTPENEIDLFVGGVLYDKNSFFADNQFHFFSTIHEICVIVFFIEVVVVTFFTYSIVLNYNEKISEYYSNNGNVYLKFIDKIILVFAFISVMAIVVNFIGKSYFVNDSTLLSLVSFMFSCAIFFLCFVTYRQDVIVTNVVDEINSSSSVSENDEIDVKEIVGSFFSLMIDEGYSLQKDVSIFQVSRKLNISYSVILKMVHESLNSNFATIVNLCRVEHAKKILVKSKLEDRNKIIASLAKDSGFTLNKSFIKVFKSITGESPLKWENK